MHNLAKSRITAIAAGPSGELVPTIAEARQLARQVLEMEDRLQALEAQLRKETQEVLPEFITKVNGSTTQAAVMLHANRSTVRKYLTDKDGRYHRIINGRLLTVTRNRERNHDQC